LADAQNRYDDVIGDFPGLTSVIMLVCARHRDGHLAA
jgi:hypothetical protein